MSENTNTNDLAEIIVSTKKWKDIFSFLTKTIPLPEEIKNILPSVRDHIDALFLREHDRITEAAIPAHEQEKSVAILNKEKVTIEGFGINFSTPHFTTLR